MIGLDTNILLRYFLQDDQAQSLTANNLLEHLLTVEDPGFVSTVTMAELVWVLSRTCGRTSEQVVSILELMLQAENLVLQNEQEVFTACMMVKAGRGSFPDAFIGELNASAGCSTTLTFDKRASRLRGFRLL